MSVELTFLDGVALHQAGQLDQAALRYQAVLAADPAHADALHYSGLIAFQRGAPAEAVDLITRAIGFAEQGGRMVPAEYQINLGNALKRTGRVAEALAAYRKAVLIRPDLSAVWFNMALVQRASGALPEAITSLEAACRGAPPLPRAWVELGECFAASGNDSEALRCFEHLLPLFGASPGSAELFDLACRVGRSLVEMGRYDAAVKVLEPLRNARPDDVECLNVLGCALSGLGRLTAAESCLARAHGLVPIDSRITDNLACALKDSGRNQEALALYRDLLEKGPVDAGVWSNYLFTLLYSDRCSVEQVVVEHRRFAQSMMVAGSGAAVSHRPESPPHRPLRLAYLSGDLHNHPVAYFMHAFFRCHDPSRVSVSVYDNGAVADEWSARLKQHVKHWRPVRALSDEQLAAQIRHDGIDVLIDLSGHTAENRLAALATHPARVQASYLGYPFSTGLPWIDWRIVDSITDPPGSDLISCERLYRLPRSYYVYSVPDGAPAVSELPAQKNGFLTFGVCSNLAKVTPATLDFWASLLRQSRNARLYWRTRAFADPAVRRSMTEALVQRGIARKRLSLEGWAAHADRWSAFHKVDVALDTYPYNQATNTCESLWMGVPTLSVAGTGHPSRMGASILGEAGLQEWVFEFDQYKNAPEPFFDRVSSLLDPGRLSALRRGLRDRLQQSRLMDGNDAARAIENACQAMIDGQRDD